MKLMIMLLSVLIFTGCKSQISKRKYRYDGYNEARNYFDPGFTDHFPDSLSSVQLSIHYSLDDEHSNLGCSLYQYEFPKDSIKALNKRLKKMSVLGNYDSDDPCLLIINRFQSLDSDDNLPVDSSLIDLECYADMYPIPNFLNLRNPPKTSGFALPAGFQIYVIDAKPGIHYPKFNASPKSYMPATWKNGYSKGIAINAKKRIVIYWSVMW